MLKKLTPQFLINLDRWLLKNEPLVWRTRVHWVLFWSGVVHALVLFGYLFYPLTVDNVPSLETKEVLQFSILGLSGFTFLIWGIHTTRRPIIKTKLKGFVLTSVLYWLGSAAIGLNAWMIYKTLDHKIAGVITDKTILELDVKHLDQSYLSFTADNDLNTFEREGIMKRYLTFSETQADVEVGNSSDTTLLKIYAEEASFYKAKQRAIIIDTSGACTGWFYLEEGSIYAQLLQFLLYAMILIPFLFLFWSVAGFSTIFIAIFALFITIITINFYSNSSGDLIGEFLPLALPTILLIKLIQFNHSKLNWLFVYSSILAVLVLTLWLIYEDITAVWPPYESSQLYDSPKIFCSLLIALVIGHGGYLYSTSVNEPQIN